MFEKFQNTNINKKIVVTCLLVSRLSNKQRSKLIHVGCYHVFLANDFIRLMRFLAMCKDSPDVMTQTDLNSFVISHFQHQFSSS